MKINVLNQVAKVVHATVVHIGGGFLKFFKGMKARLYDAVLGVINA